MRPQVARPGTREMAPIPVRLLIVRVEALVPRLRVVVQHRDVLDDLGLLAQAVEPALVQLALALALEALPERLLFRVVQLGRVGALARLEPEDVPGIAV